MEHCTRQVTSNARNPLFDVTSLTPVTSTNLRKITSGAICKALLSVQHLFRSGFVFNSFKKVQVGKDQEKAQSERDSHSKNRGGKKPN